MYVCLATTVQVGTAWMCTMVQTFLGVLYALDPFATGLWVCRSLTDAECLALHEQRQSPCPLGGGGAPRWEYLHPGWSILSSFDLACRWDPVGRAMPLGFYFVGAVAGLGLYSWFCSGTPRRRLFIWGSVMAALACLVSANSPGVASYAVLRWVAGLGSGIAVPAATALALDVCGWGWRGAAAVLLYACAALGTLGVAGLATAIPSWRVAHAITGLGALLCTALWSLAIESPSWLLLRGRKGEATASLAALASANRRRPPAAALADPTAQLAAPRRTLRDGLRVPRVRHLLLVHALAVVLLSGSYWSVAGLPQQLSIGAPDYEPLLLYNQKGTERNSSVEMSGGAHLITRGDTADAPGGTNVSVRVGTQPKPGNNSTTAMLPARDQHSYDPELLSSTTSSTAALHAVHVTAATGAAYDVLGTALALLCADRFGRRRCIAFLGVPAGMLLICAGFLPAGDGRRSLASAARAGTVGALAALGALGAEAYPGIIRERASLVALQLSTLASGLFLGVPIVGLVPASGGLPLRLLLLLAGAAIAAAVAMSLLWLPETLLVPPTEVLEEDLQDSLALWTASPEELSGLGSSIKRSRSWRVALRRILRPGGPVAATPRAEE